MSLNNTLYSLLSEVVKVPVIRANQSGAEPKKPFITYQVKWDKTPEHFHYSALNAEGEQVVSTHVESTLELQCFGCGAVDCMRSVLMKLATYSERCKWINAGVVIVDEGVLNDMPFLNEAQKYEARAVVEIAIRHTLTITDLIGFFEQVDVTNEKAKVTKRIGVVTYGEN